MIMNRYFNDLFKYKIFTFSNIFYRDMLITLIDSVDLLEMLDVLFWKTNFLHFRLLLHLYFRLQQKATSTVFLLNFQHCLPNLQ